MFLLLLLVVAGIFRRVFVYHFKFRKLFFLGNQNKIQLTQLTDVRVKSVMLNDNQAKLILPDSSL